MQRVIRNIKWIIVGFAVIIFLIILISVSSENIVNFDNNIYYIVKSFQNEGLTNLLRIITNFGGIVNLFFITIFVSMLLFYYNKRKYALMLVISMLVSSTTYIILKGIVKRPRPIETEMLIPEFGYSFPSGHTTNNTVFYGIMIYIIYKNVESKTLRNVLIALCNLMIITISFSRIYLRVHYPSDVFAGLCLGIVLVIIFIKIATNKIKSFERN